LKSIDTEWPQLIYDFATLIWPLSLV
jgi:hypothetical protein